jgi:hypothetical protein
MPPRNSWEHFNSQGVEILNNKGHVTQSLRTTGLPIANTFCPLISRGWKTRGLKVTSHSIGLSNQNPNNVAINKIWGGSEWSVPPPQTAMTLSSYTNCATIRRLMWSCAHFNWICDIALSSTSRMDPKRLLPLVSRHWGHFATITLTYLQTNNCQICHNKSSNIFLFLLKTFSAERHRYF